jgi:hypothetical protein
MTASDRFVPPHDPRCNPQRPLTFEQCIEWARLRFEDEYNWKIRQLLFNFPADSSTKEGAKFWSGACVRACVRVCEIGERLVGGCEMETDWWWV